MRRMTKEDMEYRQGRSPQQVADNEETMYLAYKYGFTFVAIAVVIKLVLELL